MYTHQLEPGVTGGAVPLLQVGDQEPSSQLEVAKDSVPAIGQQLQGALGPPVHKPQATGRDAGVVGSYKPGGVKGRDGRVPVVGEHVGEPLLQGSVGNVPDRSLVVVLVHLHRTN